MKTSESQLRATQAYRDKLAKQKIVRTEVRVPEDGVEKVRKYAKKLVEEYLNGL